MASGFNAAEYVQANSAATNSNLKEQQKADYDKGIHAPFPVWTKLDKSVNADAQIALDQDFATFNKNRNVGFVVGYIRRNDALTQALTALFGVRSPYACRQIPNIHSPLLKLVDEYGIVRPAVVAELNRTHRSTWDHLYSPEEVKAWIAAERFTYQDLFIPAGLRASVSSLRFDEAGRPLVPGAEDLPATGLGFYEANIAQAIDALILMNIDGTVYLPMIERSDAPRAADSSLPIQLAFVGGMVDTPHPCNWDNRHELEAFRSRLEAGVHDETVRYLADSWYKSVYEEGGMVALKAFLLELAANQETFGQGLGKGGMGTLFNELEEEAGLSLKRDVQVVDALVKPVGDPRVTRNACVYSTVKAVCFDSLDALARAIECVTDIQDKHEVSSIQLYPLALLLHRYCAHPPEVADVTGKMHRPNLFASHKQLLLDALPSLYPQMPSLRPYLESADAHGPGPMDLQELVRRITQIRK